MSLPVTRCPSPFANCARLPMKVPQIPRMWICISLPESAGVLSSAINAQSTGRAKGGLREDPCVSRRFSVSCAPDPPRLRNSVMSIKNAFYAQSGGVTAVINASACGVIETARRHRDRIGTVYAGRNGIIGALREELVDTDAESPEAIAALRHTPSGAFGSCRYKLKSLEENRREYERLIEVFKAHNIGYFFYNGGGDSADTCLKVSQLSETMGYPIQAIHIPKTVDNDLPLTDTCPGFGSVAKYVAVSTMEASLRSEYERLIEVFKAHNIGYFFYNGGGDSADTCLKVSQLSETMGYPIQAIHIPKTVDNDLPLTDTCPGFGSVAKYVAVSTMEASL